MAEERMQRIGLTGGIASGKSTVARMLAARGVPVVDADRLAREVVEPGMPAFEAIAARWPEVFREGRLDRAALGAIVFSDPKERAALEAITHPAIRSLAEARLAALEEAGEKRAIYEAALLFEKGLDAELDGTILVAARPETQVARIRQRDGLSHEEAWARIRAQMPIEEKRERARWIVENDGDLEELQRRVDALWSAIERG